MSRRQRKPRLTVDQARWFCQVHERITRCGGSHYWAVEGNRGYPLNEAFSDVHDGNLTVEEVRPLVRQGLLEWCPIPSDERSGSGLIGDQRTVTLTWWAVRVFWPDRITRIKGAA